MALNVAALSQKIGNKNLDKMPRPPSKNSPELNIAKKQHLNNAPSSCEDVCVNILDRANWIESRMMPTKMTLLQGSGNFDAWGAFQKACPRVVS